MPFQLAGGGFSLYVLQRFTKSCAGGSPAAASLLKIASAAFHWRSRKSVRALWNSWLVSPFVPISSKICSPFSLPLTCTVSISLKR